MCLIKTDWFIKVQGDFIHYFEFSHFTYDLCGERGHDGLNFFEQTVQE